MEQSLNFKDVFLSAEDLNILANARYGEVVKIHPVSADFLIKYGFLSQYALSDFENEFVITPLGIQYLEYIDTILLEKRKREEHLVKEEKRLKLSEIRSWIAVLISLIALIGSLLQWLCPMSR